MSTLNDLCPYNNDAVENTAENLLRYLAALGCGAASVSIDLLPGEGETIEGSGWLLNTAHMIAAHDTFLLLAEVQATDPAKADALADRIIVAAEAGDSFGEWLWQWCTERGLDAEQIATEAHEVRGLPVPKFS